MAARALALPGSAEIALPYHSSASSRLPILSAALPAITRRTDGSDSALSASATTSW